MTVFILSLGSVKEKVKNLKQLDKYSQEGCPGWLRKEETPPPAH